MLKFVRENLKFETGLNKINLSTLYIYINLVYYLYKSFLLSLNFRNL